MLFRGTASKRSAALGSAALVAGATLSALGLTTAPAAHADAPGVAYSCTLTIPGFPADQFDTTADFTGTAPPSAQEGDSVSLDDVSVTVHVPLLASLNTLLAQSITGTLSPIEVDAANGDADGQTERTGASIVDVPGPVVGPFDLTAAPGSVSGFVANKPGLMTFGAGSEIDGELTVQPLVGDPRAMVLQCSRSGPAATIASTNVTPKPSTPPPSHPSSPSAPPSSSTPPPTHGASAPPSLSNASPTPSSETSSSTSTEVGTSNTNRTTAQHPQLANTGFSQAEDLTIGGGLLVLLGGGLIFAARRRSATDLDT